jgi:hypothetical protein
VPILKSLTGIESAAYIEKGRAPIPGSTVLARVVRLAT